MLDRMNKLIKDNMYLLTLKAKYTNLTREEIIQTARCAYCFNPDIDIYYQSGEINTARKLFLREYKLLVRNEAFHKSVNDNNKMTRLINKLKSDCSELYEFECDLSIPDDEVLSIARGTLGDDNYFFLLKYYDVGMSRCADIYNMSEGSCRVKVHRLIARIQEKINV